MPEDIRNIILEEQLKLKQKKNTFVYSMESTIYAMLRDYIKIRKTQAND